MPIRRATLPELREQVASDLSSRLGVGPLLRRSMLRVLAEALAGAVHGLYGYLDWVWRQLFPDLAEAEQLERWASIWGVQRKPATFATGVATFKGATGAVIPVGTQLRRTDGWRYETSAGAVFSGSTVIVPVIAVDAGAGGNAPQNTALFLVSPLTGVLSGASVGVPLEGGTLSGAEDQENDAALRARLLERLRRPPRGGAAGDYVSWALAVPGVTRAWAFPSHQGLGTVGVAIMRDDDATGGPFPSSGELDEVAAYIEERRPVTAEVIVFALAAVPVNFTIGITPDTPDLRTAVAASLADLIVRDGEPGGTLYISRIREAISTTPGEFNHVLTLPAADVVVGPTSLATMGVITWS